MLYKQWIGEPDKGFDSLTPAEEAAYDHLRATARPDDSPSDLANEARNVFPGRWVYRGGSHIAVHLGATGDQAGECAFRLQLI